MASLICGSLAFDNIMTFSGRFADQIMPDQIHILNVSFLVPTLRRDFGGCAGNIAYALNLLGGQALPMAVVGHDGDGYVAHFKALGIDTRFIKKLDDHYTAQCMITTDMDNNQITAFHPGAMMQAHENTITKDCGAAIGIVAPDGRDAMLQHAEQLHAAGIPFVFDPGQGLPMFDGNDLRHFISLATWVTVNDYEGKMLSERTGLSFAEISNQVQALMVTLGAEGCELWEKGERSHVPGLKAAAVVDPTGCGDAWRGGLLWGLEQGRPLRSCVELGNRMGALKIAARGPQNYQLDFDPATV
ncbi:adenosine kinase [Comamonas sp. BIGb0152]|uniref:carbohydrate kinase family protein n=1 Tax=Comamonas sp. BIGb0152 TaxID=2940601 RepID=UPI002167D655|nr:carbohydrate kinase family protein [Comamonas sp. BIGb0152]MCS4292383.1 adenosine kinase [Comamonas sp. BIGb0152]